MNDQHTPPPGDRQGAASSDEEPAGRSATATDARSSSPAGQPPPARLVRLPDEGPGAGVAAGLGAYFGVDPVLFRIAFVVLTLAGGSGVLLYAIAWIVMPEGTPEEAARHARPASSDKTAQWAGLALILAAALWLSGPFDLAPPILWGLALLAVGVLIFREDANRRAGRQPTEPGERAAAVPAERTPSGVVTEPPSPAQQDEYEGWSAAGWESPAPGWPTPASPPAPPAPRRSILTRATLGMALVVVGLLALAENAIPAVAISPARYLGVLLLVIGGGLLIGAWWGRARGLIVLGLLLVPLVAATTFWPYGIPWRGGAGERTFSPVALEDVRDEYELGAGQLVVDLSGVDFGDEPTPVRASVGLGELLVVVPDDVDVLVHARATAGELSLLGESVSGTRLDHSVDAPAPAAMGAGEEPLVLDLSAGLGQVTVSRGQ